MNFFCFASLCILVLLDPFKKFCLGIHTDCDVSMKTSGTGRNTEQRNIDRDGTDSNFATLAFVFEINEPHLIYIYSYK